MLNEIVTLTLMAGTLGTAVFGIVETLKWTFVGQFGFNELRKHLGHLMKALEVSYASDPEELLRAMYRGEQNELARSLRQGVRAGLTVTNAEFLAQALQTIDKEMLVKVANALSLGQELSSEQRAILGRFELAADAHVEAALLSAQSHYIGKVRLLAGVAAVVIALVLGLIQSNGVADWDVMVRMLLVGVLAIPVAPIAKDVVTTLQSISALWGARS